MTVSEIEVEARAYVEAYLERFSGADDQCFRYLRAMLNVIDELRAPRPGADVQRERAAQILDAVSLFSGGLRARLMRALQQYGDERAAAAIDEILYWRKIALELKAELATARETPATAPGQNGR